VTLWEWLDDQRKQALAHKDDSYPEQGEWKYWQGYAAALQDVQNYVE